MGSIDYILGKVDTLMAAINSRGFGDPPYEGPEYEKYINVDVEWKQKEIWNQKQIKRRI